MYDLFPPALVRDVMKRLADDGFTLTLGKSWVDGGCFRAVLKVKRGARIVYGYIAADDEFFSGRPVYGDCMFAFEIKGDRMDTCRFSVDSFQSWVKHRICEN